MAFRFDQCMLWVALSLGLGLAISPRASLAYTPEQQQACTPDAMRLCGDFVPNVDAITACMVQKKAQLSPQCRVFFRQGPEPSEMSQPVNLRPAPVKTTKSKVTTTKKSSSSRKTKKSSDEDG